MIKKDENSFQLLFTALVLVLIAVGGTLAWFASNRTATWGDYGAHVTSPTDGDDFDGDPLEYYNALGQFSEFGDAVTYVPGKCMIFRVSAEPHSSATVQLILEGTDKPVLGDAIKIGFYDELDSSWRNPGGQLTEANFPVDDLTDTINDLAQVGVRGWTVTSPVSPKYDGTVNPSRPQDYLYFFLYMDPMAGEEPDGLQSGATYETYQNLEMSFKVKVTYS